MDVLGGYRSGRCVGRLTTFGLYNAKRCISNSQCEEVSCVGDVSEVLGNIEQFDGKCF